MRKRQLLYLKVMNVCIVPKDTLRNIYIALITGRLGREPAVAERTVLLEVSCTLSEHVLQGLMQLCWHPSSSCVLLATVLSHSESQSSLP